MKVQRYVWELEVKLEEGGVEGNRKREEDEVEVGVERWRREELEQRENGEWKYRRDEVDQSP